MADRAPFQSGTGPGGSGGGLAAAEDRGDAMGSSYRRMLIQNHRSDAVCTLVKVRWVASFFALVQVAATSGYPAGAEQLAYATVGLLFFGNVVLWWLTRDRSADASRFGLASLILDFIVVTGLVAVFTFDPAVSIASIIYILPLEAALIYQRKGAIAIMAAATMMYVVREFLGYLVYDHEFLTQSVTFRMGIGWIIALVSGTASERLVEERDRLAVSQRRLDALLRNSRDVTLVVDELGTIKHASGAVKDLSGYDDEEVLGLSIIDLLHPEHRRLGADSLGHIAKRSNTSVSGTFRLVMKNGNEKWIEVKARNGKADDAIRGILLNVDDVTAIKTAEVELAEANKRLATLLANIPGMAYRCHNDQDWTIEYVSDGALELTGFPPEEFVSGRISFGELIHPDDRGAVWNHVQLKVNAGRPFRIEYRIFDAQGRERWVMEQGRQVDDGFLEGLVLDVTDRKQLEANLVHAQKMDAVGRLAGGIAHDFNNILAVIVSYADLVASDLPDEDQLAQDIKEIRKAGERGANLVRQLLGFSRHEVNVPEVLTLSEAVGETGQMLRRTLGEDVAVEMELGSRGCILVDRNQLEQVLLNLAVNARDAMRGGGTLRFETTDVHVLEREEGSRGPQPGRYVLLRVRDTGEGIPEAILPHVFEPFFTTKQRGRGTGLGLATVYGIIQQAGAYIDVSSEPGRGTTFNIYWPLSHATPSEALPEVSASRESGRSGARVLLVEDEEQVRRVIERILSRGGHEVVVTTSPRDALERLQVEGIDLMLTDIVMPGMSGRELVEAAEARGSCPPVVFMSGYDEDSLTQKGATSGERPLIQKPFTADGLLTVIEDVLSGASRAS